MRPASTADLPDVLRLYAQPALDDGKVISLTDAERIFKRMAQYPDPTKIRAVTHLDVSRADCERAIDVLRSAVA